MTRAVCLLRLLPLMLALLGCEVEIGDDCQTSADCSQSGPRLCLTEALEGYPGGYCTLFNCEPGGCPSEAVCVGYRTELSGSPECSSALPETRLQRTFCMRSCSSDSDCRHGYDCVELGGADPWGAEVLEGDDENTKVCTLAYAGPDTPEDRSSDVCIDRPLTPPDVTAARDAGASNGTGSQDAGRSRDAGSGNAGRFDAGGLDAATEAGTDAAGLTDAAVRPDAAAAMSASDASSGFASAAPSLPDAAQPAVE